MGYAAQLYAASWATKTAFVIQQLHATDDFIPTSDYRNFHRKIQPSSNVFVLMGARHIAGGSKGGNLFEYKGQFIGGRERGIQHVHFAIGALYFGLLERIDREVHLCREVLCSRHDGFFRRCSQRFRPAMSPLIPPEINPRAKASRAERQS